MASSKNVGKDNGQYKHGLYVGQNNSKRLRKLYVMPETCQMRGCTNKSQVWHHRDGDKTNNKRKNLAALCRSCHAKLHRLFEYENGRIDDYVRGPDGKFVRG